jgi:hypothetical protein
MGIESILPAVIGGGASMLASSNAASAQKDAAAQSAALQQQMFDKQVELQAPFRAGGLTAQNRLLTLLGLSPDAATYGTANPNYGATGAAAGVNTTDQYNLPQGLSVNAASPDFGKYARDFGMQDFTADPGYAFRLSEGMKGLNAQAAARGGLISGAALKAATNYGQQAGSQEYQNAYTRYQLNRNNQLNPLQSLMGAGQTGANQLTAAAGTLGQGLGQAAVAGGNAQAGGYLNMANSVNNALTQGMSSYNQNQYLNRFGGGGGGGGGSFLSPSQGGSGFI